MKFTNSLSGTLQGIVLSEIPDFDQQKIYTDLLVEDNFNSFPPLKRIITRNINKVISNCKHFKIGKTGAPKKRFNNYKKYKTMLLLCHCSDAYVIDHLEAYYNDMYFDFPNNDNKNRGSACVMANRGDYFLYMVIS